MHARELTELAAVAAAQGPMIVQLQRPLSASGVEDYWVSSKCRLDRWGRALRRIGSAAGNQHPADERADWPFLRGVLEEVLTGEMLTRVWAAVLAAHDRQLGGHASEPVARSVLIAHLEARHRTLSLMVRGGALGLEWAVRLNRLRRRCERWTDMLVGYLVGIDPDVAEFAVEPDRARDFAEDLRYRSQLAGGRHAWPLVLTSIRTAFRRGLATSSPNGDLNEQIATSILACFPSEMFDATGLFQSAWLARLSSVSNDAQRMLDGLLKSEE
jgi:hypothetical protein